MSRNGVFVAVVGPSGAGKDTLLNGAAKALADRPDILFVRRIITRAPDGATEDHDTMSVEAFQAAKQAGDFCLSWHANGLHYALPRSTLDAQKAGRTVVANLSRAILSEICHDFRPILLIEVSAAQHILAARLLARGRETAEAIEERIKRARNFDVPACVSKHVIIENSGSLDTGVNAMIKALRAAVSLVSSSSA
ncbi:phosphonate metabolism protein/1,5-bisphosphokinase (PRPP-forming) PhnN [Tianweitania sp. BSSL-BM11]|uniref:Ribose 1,5-bisphosphate phosphokinase PhnN n=1 Tax=Tianweitania aestuarii TaxID=2814886 RepID=A0ABS5RR52_9HYPH|nr:phosphonate metabolism protein/1,5-bisphosphokinase (PRPP-forming) PhnN [Tianweitania aestuarii]